MISILCQGRDIQRHSDKQYMELNGHTCIWLYEIVIKFNRGSFISALCLHNWIHWMCFCTSRVFDKGSPKMWKAAAGQSVKVAVDEGGDDWETDPDFEVALHTIFSHGSFYATQSHCPTHRFFAVYFPRNVSRMIYPRRSSAGVPRQWLVQDIRGTSSENVVFSVCSQDQPQTCHSMICLHWNSIHQLRETVSTEHTSLKQQELDNMPKASHGYGGKFGVQQDRMDKVRERQICWWFYEGCV